MDSLLSFPVGLFHPLQTCRFIPTLSEWPLARQTLRVLVGRGFLFDRLL
jgi:hypothetical protein